MRPDADPIARLHAAVDEAAAQLAARHQGRLHCRLGCVGCCTDDLTVFTVEAEQIRRHHADLLAEQAPHPAGACAFLALDGSGACRVYAHRPYVCRTQGLPLRWIEEVLAEDDSLDVYEYRDICPLNDGEDAPPPPLEALEPDDLWTLGPVEEQLAALQPDGERIALRDLFTAAPPAASPGG